MRTRHTVAVAAAALAVLLFAACADEPGEPGEPDRPGATPSQPSSPGPTQTTPPAVPAPPVKPTPPPPSAGAALTGEVIAGVEPGCKLLQTDQGDYLLIGEAARDLRTGTTVTVRGQVRTDMASTCQQGTLFEVTEVLG